MKNIHSFAAVIVAGILTFSGCNTKKESDMKPPVAKKIPKELSIHRHTRIDNYYWLNERENPEVIAYLEAENKYLENQLADVKDLREKLYREMTGRIKQTDMSVPYLSNGYYYYTRFEEGKEYPVFCRKKDKLENPEEIMLNVNELAEGTKYCDVSGLRVSPDNRLLAYGIDTVSRRLYAIKVKDLTTGKTLDEHLINASPSVAWANDNKSFFYVVKDESLRPWRVYRHILGKPSSTDELVFEEKDPAFNIFVFNSKSKKYIFIGSESTTTSEYLYLEADKPGGRFIPVLPRQKGLEYSAEHFGDYFYIRTNLDAENFKLVKCPIGKQGTAFWEDVVPHRSDILLEYFDIFNNYLVTGERKNGLNLIRIYDWKSMKDHYISFPDPAYTAYVSVNPEFETDQLRYVYASMTTPSSVFDYNMKTRQQTLLKQEEVLGDFNPKNYVSERIYATAKDGKKIPVSMVYRKGMKRNGKNPLLLYGYGSYGYSLDAGFNSARLSLLDRGFIFAIAHIRGGEEMGRQWYEDGKLLKKMNTFTDFIACAEYLIAEKYTSPDYLCAMGGSAGGLLMGAVVNMRPDLFRAVVAAVPFVDVVTTMLDKSIPLTTGEFDEWGNPEDKVYYDYMLSYSPYDNVRAQEYPAMLVTTGLHDSQVQYWEPAKWVAKLREMKTDNHLLLLYTNMDTGHGGSSGRFEKYKDIALEYVFLLKELGITKQ